MKKLLIISSFLISTFALFSQEEVTPYKFFVGGALSFDNASETDNDVKQNIFRVSPYIGYSISEQVIVGLSLGLFQSKTTHSISESKLRSFSVTPFTRYRKSVSKRMGFYGELGARFSVGQYESTSGGQTTTNPKNNIFQVYIGPGIDFAFADRWVVNAGWGVLSYGRSSEEDIDNKYNAFQFNMNAADINFSLNYLF